MRHAVLIAALVLHAHALPAPAQLRPPERARPGVSLASRQATRLFDGAATAAEPAGAATAALGRVETPAWSWAKDGAGPQPGRRSTGRLVAGGLLGGAIGFFGGGIAGAAIACDDTTPEDDLCAVGGFIIGASIAESVLLPLGVHAANDRRGDYLPSFAVSAALTGAALWLASINGDGIYLIPVPPLQLLASIGLERETAD